MPYTRNWTTAIPSGGSAASGADNDQRALRVDIEERLVDILGVPQADIDEDPIIDPEISNTRLGERITAVEPEYRFYHWSRFYPILYVATDYAEALDGTSIGLDTASGNKTMICDAQLPVGCVVTEIRAYFQRSGAADQVTLTLLEQVLTGAVASSESSVATVTSTGSSTGTIENAEAIGLTVDIEADKLYYLTLLLNHSATTGPRFVGVRLRVTY